MKFIIIGKNIDVTPGLKDAVENKLGKLQRYFTPDTEIHVTLSVQKEHQKIEVTIPVKGNIIRSEQESDDMYVSIDLVEEIIERQILKYKRKLVDRKQSAPAFSEAFRNEETPIPEDEIKIVKTKKLTFGAMCLAISLLLPQVFHIIGMQQAGSIFLPMHLPVFIGGMLLGPIYGLFLGIFAPLTSFVVTGMPSADRVLFMMSELATYGMMSGLLFHQFHFSKQKFGALSALIISMIAGRVVYGIVISIATYIFGIPLGGIPAVIAATTTGIPGIIIQLIFVPTIVMAIVKGGYFDEVAATTKKA